MNKIKIPIQLLEAATISVAKNDIRTYLNGVAINRGHVVSTDGHRVFACKIDNLDKDFEVIIPTETVKAFIKKVPVKNRSGFCLLEWNSADKQGELSVSSLKIRELFIGIDGKFPDWRRIIPSKSQCAYSGPQIQFNWEYIVDSYKFFKILGGKDPQRYVRVFPNTLGAGQPARIEFENIEFRDAVYVDMPLKG